MALTRKMLKAMGIEEEKIDQIIEAHVETVDGLKADIDKYKANAEKLPGVQRELDELKAKGDDGWKEKHDKVKKDFDDYKADITAKETRSAKEKAYKALLKETGVAEKYIEDVLGVAKLDDLELKDGKFTDAEKIAAAVKEKFSSFIVTTHTTGAATATPHTTSGATPKTKEEILAIKDGAARRQAMLENPRLFGIGNAE